MLTEWCHHRVIMPMTSGQARSSIDAFEHMRIPGSVARTVPNDPVQPTPKQERVKANKGAKAEEEYRNID